MPGPPLVDVDPQITAEARAFVAQAEAMLATLPGPDQVPLEAQRAESLATAPPRLPHGVDELVTALGRDVGVRMLVPDRVDGVYLHIHGGGWTMGAADRQDPHLWAIATGASLAVVSVEYRLAPEHPFPANALDCETAAVWLVEHALARFGTDRLCVGGESAGAHLSALTLLRLRDAHGLGGRFCGANLVYGAFDLALSPSARAWGERNLILSTPIITWHADQLLPGVDEAGRRSPDVSPLFASLDDLCPALFTVGTEDPVLDDSVVLAERWAAAGNEARLDAYEGGFHAFNLMPLRLGAVANERQIAWLRDRVAPT